MTTIHFDRYKFNASTKEMTEEQLNKIDAEIWEAIHDPDKIRARHSYCEQLWHKEYVDVHGYRFTLQKEYEHRILVNRINGKFSQFLNRIVPSLDSEIVEAYIKTYDGKRCAWIVLNPERHL